MDLRKILTVFSCLGLAACGGGQALQKMPATRKARYRPPSAELAQRFLWPLEAPLSSVYGPRHGRFHSGIDIDGEKGDPVRAAAAGEVVYSAYYGAYGNFIVLKHGPELFSAYAHQEKNLVKVGQKIRSGQIIGRVGATGSATGAHLHFEIRDGVGTFDPVALLPGPRNAFFQKKSPAHNQRTTIPEPAPLQISQAPEENIEELEMLPLPAGGLD